MFGVNCYTIKLREETGTAFATPDERVNVYVDQPRVTINIISPSPRILLNHTKYWKCDRAFQMNSRPLCQYQFDMFDNKVMEFLNLDLVLEAKNKLLVEKFGAEAKAPISPINNTQEQAAVQAIKKLQKLWAKPLRKRRVAPAIVAGGIAVGSVAGGYFVGKAHAAKGMEEVNEKLRIHENAILRLSKVINVNEKNIIDIAKQLQANPKLVLSTESNLPFDIEYRAALTIQDFRSGRLDVSHTLHISDLVTREFNKISKSSLTLQNHRLPLQRNFLLAVRTKCLALQQRQGDAEKQFCNELAFYSTRWDTGLQFHGIGVVYLDNEQTMIKNLVYSFEVDIPILDGTPIQKIDIFNLGRFTNSSQIKTVVLPKHAVITKSGSIRPLDITKCKSTSTLTVCPSWSISAFSECLHSIYTGFMSTNCLTETKTIPSTCIGETHDNFVLVSLPKPLIVHYGVHIKSVIPVKEFDIINRTDTKGQILCSESGNLHTTPLIQVPKRQQEAVFNFTHKVIRHNSGSLISLETTNEKLESLNKQYTSSEKLLNQTASELKSKIITTNSTLDILEENVANAIHGFPKQIENGVFSIFNSFMLPILAPFIAFGFTAFVILAIGLCCMKYVKSKLIKRRPLIVSPVPIERNQAASSRTETTLIP